MFPPLANTPESQFLLKEILAELASHTSIVESNDERRAAHQEQQTVILGQMAAWLIGFGWVDEAGKFGADAFRQAKRTWEIRNPEPMMKAVHRHWLNSQGLKEVFIP